jgi:uncharacterized protein (DUF1684 family)
MELLDWRRQVALLYRAVRESTAPPEATLAEFRNGRDRLFKSHPQSPLSERRRPAFDRLDYFDYDVAMRVVGRVEAVEPQRFEMPAGEDGTVVVERFGAVRFELAGQAHSLSLFWIAAYGGGLFLPFRDATNGDETYGGGRYLFDTVKHADLGGDGDTIVLDFNYAYNPSCCYDDRWVCPLAPPESLLAIPIPAGERAFRR